MLVEGEITSIFFAEEDGSIRPEDIYLYIYINQYALSMDVGDDGHSTLAKWN